MLNTGIILKEKAKVDFVKSGTDHIYHGRTGLQFQDSSNQTMILSSLSFDKPTSQGERTTQFKLPLNTTGWVFENDSVIYGFVNNCTLVKYSVPTGQVLGVVDTKLQPSACAFWNPTLLAVQQGFLIVNGSYGSVQLQKVVADKVRWNCTIEAPHGLRNTAVENRGVLYFVACRSQHPSSVYVLFGIDSATGELLIRVARQNCCIENRKASKLNFKIQ